MNLKTYTCTKCGKENVPDEEQQGKCLWCRACYNDYAKRYARMVRAKDKAGYLAKQRERRRKILALDPDYYKRRYNPESKWKADLKKKFNITLDDYNKMHDEQKGLCAICGRPETKVARGKLYHLAVDHDHKHSKVRALLCCRCNGGLGHFDDDPKMLRKAIAYLKRHT